MVPSVDKALSPEGGSARRPHSSHASVVRSSRIFDSHLMQRFLCCPDEGRQDRSAILQDLFLQTDFLSVDRTQIGEHDWVVTLSDRTNVSERAFFAIL